MAANLWFGADPWMGLDEFRREVAQLLDRVGGHAPGRAGFPFPPVNLYETADGYVLTAEVPGVRAEDLDVSVEGNRVTLRGERRIELPEGARASLHRRERQGGIFRRTLELPDAADVEKIQAVTRNGVLMLHVPKAPAHQPRRVAVQTA